MKTLPEGWTDRHTRVARFALHMMHMNAEARALVIRAGQPAPPGTAERLEQDGKDALEARALLEQILEVKGKAA